MDLDLLPTNTSFDVSNSTNLAVDRVASFIVQIADAPIAFRLPGRFLNDDRFDAVVVPHRVGLLRDGGYREIIRLGLHAQYETDVPGQTFSVLTQLPAPEFVDVGKMLFGASVDGRGDLKPIAEAPVPDGDARFEVSAGGSVGAELNVSLRLVTPRIGVIGLGAQEALWTFAGDGKYPLHGKTIETWSVVVVPSGAEEIRYRLRVWMRHRLFLLPNDWSGVTKEPIRAPVVDLAATPPTRATPR